MSKKLLGKLGIVVLIIMFISPLIKAKEEKNILILNSYDESYQWTKELEQGVMNNLKKKEAIIYHEYMDTKRIADSIHFKNLYNLYNHKYHDIDLDLIITTDNHAFNFLLSYRDRLFGNIPVVFTGVNNFSLDMLQEQQNYYGIDEDINIEKTVDIALDLHPQAKKVVAFFSNSVTGDEFKNIFRTTIANHLISTSIYQTNNINEVKEKLESVPQNSVIFSGLILNDAEGNLLPVKKAMREISNSTTKPIYSFWEFYLGSGIVGGNLLSAQIKGEATAELALDVLAGKVEDKTIVTGSFSRYSFDYQELNRLGIEESFLPSDSKIIKQPTSFYYQYSTIIWLVIIIFIILVALIIGLIIYSNKYRKAITKLDDIFSETNLVFWSFDVRNDKLLEISESCFDVYGYSQSDFYTNPNLLCEVVVESERSLIYNKQQKMKSNSNLNSISIEYRIEKKNDEQRWVKEHNIAFRDSNDNLTRIDGIVLDITDRKEVEEELISYANYDTLTGVYNRRMGLSVLKQNKERIMKQGTKLTVCFVDINNLKFVNDNYSHEEGDRMIKTVVKVIRSEVRERDTVIRLGGDEFLISFPDCSKKEAEVIWQRIVNKFKEINQGSEFDYKIIVSHGLAEYDDNNEKVDTIEKLINLADERMYLDKKKLKEIYSVQKD